MERKLIKAFGKFAILLLLISAILFILLGTVILLFPDLFFKALIYIVGIALVITGMVIIVSLIRAYHLTKK